MTFGQFITRVALPIVVIAGGYGGYRRLVDMPPSAKRSPKPTRAPLAEVIAAAPSAFDVAVYAQGTVVPARRVTIQAQVAGRVFELGPDLVDGGHVRADDLLFRIEGREYEMAIEQRRADVTRASYELDVERGRKSMAEREWKLLQTRRDETDEPGRRLALREPHLRNAEAAVGAAKSRLGRARLDLDRTRVRAPFNALIESETIEIGQIVRPGAPAATLVGTDTFWIQVSLPPSEMAWINLPPPDSDAMGGSRVRVTYDAGGERVEREGRVRRLLGQLDPIGRMARLIVEIQDPLRLALPPEERGMPLLLGAFVDVEIAGRELRNAYALPRHAVREGDRVWIVDANDTLEIRDVHVARRERERVLVDDGLHPGDRVITSRLLAPVPNMSVRAQPAANALTARAPTADAVATP